MGKKFFRRSSEAATRPDGDEAKRALTQEAAASAPESRMRQLIERDYTPEQVALLRQIAQSTEGAAKYSEQNVLVQDVVTPSSSDVLRQIAEQTGLRIVNLRDFPRADAKLRAVMTADQAKKVRAIPVEEKEDGTIVMAVADPSNPMIADDLRLILGREVETVIADEEEIDERIEAYYGMGDESLQTILDKDEGEVVDENVIHASTAEIDISPETLANAPPVIKLVQILLLRAINDRASDIHIEPFPAFIRIRYRVDGVLREIPSPPRSQLVAIVSRVKVMAGMNISESRLPQDGRIKLTNQGREVDMRVSTVPTVHGESVVMRVLDRSMMMIGISQIGMLSEVLEEFKRIIRKPNGIVLVTGPTGCGKTTTLYAALSEVRDPGEKLITTEDPVEYELEGIQQVNINENVGLTFARCLRSILRQDPDRVLVGEIRDTETAQIAVQAALTGHLVFSTLHTNSAAATVTRLLDMGVEPFLITSSLEAIIGQRLVRTVCPICKVPYTPTDEELSDFGKKPEEIKEQGIVFYHGEGCPECSHSGYRGRMGIFEMLTITDEVRELVLERATTDEIHDLALRQGMISMRTDGYVKAAMGMTTLSEIARQTPKEAPMLVGRETEMAEEKISEELLEGHARQALPKPPEPKLDEKTMGVEGEAAQKVEPDDDKGKKP
jgi:type II secretion system protein E